MFEARAGTQRRRELREEPAGSRGSVLALDLGGTQIRAAAIRQDGSIAARRARRTPVDEGPAAIVRAGRDALREGRAEFGRDSPEAERSLVGISLSSPGPIDPWRGVIVEPPNLGPEFRDVPLAERMEDDLGLPAYLERDTRIAALGEGAFGAARGSTEYLYVTVSSGVGGAIVTEGRLLMGPDGTAGELGHFPVDFHGPPCGCGGVVHLEAFASGVAIAREAPRAGGGGPERPSRGKLPAPPPGGYGSSPPRSVTTSASWAVSSSSMPALATIAGGRGVHRSTPRHPRPPRWPRRSAHRRSQGAPIT